MLGSTAGFATPKCIVDTPIGKKPVSSFDVYEDSSSGISIYSGGAVWNKRKRELGRSTSMPSEHTQTDLGMSPPENFFVYVDPLHSLSPHIQQRWQNRDFARSMLQDACDKVKEFCIYVCWCWRQQDQRDTKGRGG